jgi:predicted Zn-dependent protease
VSLRIGLAEVLVEAGRSIESRDLLLPLLEQRREDDPWSLLLLCALAEAEREIGDDAGLEEADQHSERALELAPGSAWAMLVRASVLLARSRFHPALALLEKARDLAGERLLVDECDCWLILADHRRGNREHARERLAHLQKRGTMGRLILAVETEVLGRPAASVASPAESA